MITVIGSINLDMIARCDRAPAPGETVEGLSLQMAPGGKGANQALAAARAGSIVSLLGSVGNDDLARKATHLLQQAGIDMSKIMVSTVNTGTAHIVVSGDGENRIVVVPGANGSLTEAHVTRAVSAMSESDILVLQLEVPANCVEKALALAKRRGIKSILNVAPFTVDAARLARLADMIIANECEFAQLAGASVLTAQERIDALGQFHEESGSTVIVTLGAAGVIAVRDGVIYSAKGLSIKPVDTVGAGDTFCGYLASGLDRGDTFRLSLGKACVAASLACLKLGAQLSVPFADEVAAVLQQDDSSEFSAAESKL